MIGWRIFPWQARAIFVSQSSEALRLLGCCPFRCGCWLVLLFPRRQIPSRLDLRDGGFQPSLRIPLNTWLLIGYPLSWSHHHLSTVISCNYPRISSGHPGLAWYMFCLSRAGPAGPCFNIRREIQSSDSYPFATRGHCQSSHRWKGWRCNRRKLCSPKAQQSPTLPGQCWQSGNTVGMCWHMPHIMSTKCQQSAQRCAECVSGPACCPDWILGMVHMDAWTQQKHFSHAEHIGNPYRTRTTTLLTKEGLSLEHARTSLLAMSSRSWTDLTHHYYYHTVTFSW